MLRCTDRAWAPSMNQRPVSRNVAILFVVVLATIGCNDLPPAPDADVRPFASVAPAGLALDPDSDGWNRFEADLAVLIDGPSGPLMPRDASRGLSYRVVKRRDANGVWLTDIEMKAYRPRVGGAESATAPLQSAG